MNTFVDVTGMPVKEMSDCLHNCTVALMNLNVWFQNSAVAFFLLPDEMSITQYAYWKGDSHNPTVYLFWENI